MEYDQGLHPPSVVVFPTQASSRIGFGKGRETPPMSPISFAPGCTSPYSLSSPCTKRRLPPRPELIYSDDARGVRSRNSSPQLMGMSGILSFPAATSSDVPFDEIIVSEQGTVVKSPPRTRSQSRLLIRRSKVDDYDCPDDEIHSTLAVTMEDSPSFETIEEMSPDTNAPVVATETVQPKMEEAAVAAEKVLHEISGSPSRADKSNEIEDPSSMVPVPVTPDSQHNDKTFEPNSSIITEKTQVSSDEETWLPCEEKTNWDRPTIKLVRKGYDDDMAVVTDFSKQRGLFRVDPPGRVQRRQPSKSVERRYENPVKPSRTGLSSLLELRKDISRTHPQGEPSRGTSLERRNDEPITPPGTPFHDDASTSSTLEGLRAGSDWDETTIESSRTYCVERTQGRVVELSLHNSAKNVQESEKLSPITASHFESSNEEANIIMSVETSSTLEGLKAELDWDEETIESSPTAVTDQTRSKVVEPSLVNSAEKVHESEKRTPISDSHCESSTGNEEGIIITSVESKSNPEELNSMSLIEELENEVSILQELVALSSKNERDEQATSSASSNHGGFVVNSSSSEYLETKSEETIKANQIPSEVVVLPKGEALEGVQDGKGMAGVSAFEPPHRLLPTEHEHRGPSNQSIVTVRSSKNGKAGQSKSTSKKRGKLALGFLPINIDPKRSSSGVAFGQAPRYGTRSAQANPAVKFSGDPFEIALEDAAQLAFAGVRTLNNVGRQVENFVLGPPSVNGEDDENSLRGLSGDLERKLSKTKIIGRHTHTASRPDQSSSWWVEREVAKLEMAKHVKAIVAAQSNAAEESQDENIELDRGYDWMDDSAIFILNDLGQVQNTYKSGALVSTRSSSHHISRNKEIRSTSINDSQLSGEVPQNIVVYSSRDEQGDSVDVVPETDKEQLDDTVHPGLEFYMSKSPPEQAKALGQHDMSVEDYAIDGMLNDCEDFLLRGIVSDERGVVNDERDIDPIMAECDDCIFGNIELFDSDDEGRLMNEVHVVDEDTVENSNIELFVSERICLDFSGDEDEADPSLLGFQASVNGLTVANVRKTSKSRKTGPKPDAFKLPATTTPDEDRHYDTDKVLDGHIVSTSDYKDEGDVAKVNVIDLVASGDSKESYEPSDGQASGVSSMPYESPMPYESDRDSTDVGQLAQRNDVIQNPDSPVVNSVEAGTPVVESQHEQIEPDAVSLEEESCLANAAPHETNLINPSFESRAPDNCEGDSLLASVVELEIDHLTEKAEPTTTAAEAAMASKDSGALELITGSLVERVACACREMAKVEQALLEVEQPAEPNSPTVATSEKVLNTAPSEERVEVATIPDKTTMITTTSKVGPTKGSVSPLSPFVAEILVACQEKKISQSPPLDSTVMQNPAQLSTAEGAAEIHADVLIQEGSEASATPLTFLCENVDVLPADLEALPCESVGGLPDGSKTEDLSLVKDDIVTAVVDKLDPADWEHAGVTDILDLDLGCSRALDLDAQSAADVCDDSATAITGCSEVTELQSNTSPVLVKSLDDHIGIEKGDIMISLLNGTVLQVSVQGKWAGQVQDAIWRSRTMRRNFNGQGRDFTTLSADGATRRRSSLPIDVDDVCVAGGIRSIGKTEAAAIEHLKNDEVEQALELYEGIIFAYYSYFDGALKRYERRKGFSVGHDVLDFRPFIGTALHNLGIINLLHGDYGAALSFFHRAAENRKVCLGQGHVDYVTSIVKSAVCQFALNDFARAQSLLEEALDLAKAHRATLGDHCQVAEILNNLGCLSYMCGESAEASRLFQRSLDVQLAVMSRALYSSSAKLASQSASLSIAITRSNIGCLKLATNETALAITYLESSLMQQQYLLHTGHDSIIATMDHLVVAQVAAGNRERALQMVGRTLQAQLEVHGPKDIRFRLTLNKIKLLRNENKSDSEVLYELQRSLAIESLPKGSRIGGKTSGLQALNPN